MVKKIKKKKRRKSRARGDCFRLSFNFLDALGRDKAVEVYLVHGIPTLRDERTLESTGKRYGHAWVEFVDFVFDSAANMMIPKDAYYEEGQIDEAEVVRYTLDEARKLVVEHEHYGPWDERLEAEDIVYANQGAKK